MSGHSTYAHKCGAFAVHLQRVADLLSHLVQIVAVGIVGQLMDQGHIRLAHAEDEIILPVGEQALDHIHGHGLQTLVNGADNEYAPVDLHRHMQLLGTHINIADEDVVGNDILNKGTLVMLFFIVSLGRVQRHAGHSTDRAAHAVVAAGKNGIVKVAAPAGQSLKGLALNGHAVAVGQLDGLHILGPLLSDPGELAAGNDAALGVHYADDAVRCLLELQHDILKNPSRHDIPPGHP